MDQNQPKNYLVESILVTIFCCLPFGIAGIVFASQVNTKFSSGDYQGAQEASENAKKWMKWGLFSGIAVILLYVIFIFALGGAAILGLNNNY
ncbi:CD225/dispanin family protein [uncultured Lutibacter sp.]|uniref:CD225/dispanin family protein n=1 Tax=uncultured Lutibacter sp. TaxID=437739 RepID=UPI0026182DC1|nr:CD225/dispanin family protein [uncultured Lutibacter sp.]